jgi:hypothetical protein
MVGVLGMYGAACAAADNEYPNGIEGIKAGSVPPPGFYYKMYNVFYTADTLKDNNGKDLNVGFDVKTFVNAHRFIWITDHKILGADYGMDVVVPLMNVDLKISGFGVDDSQFGLGDIFFEPLILYWHGPRYDLSFGAGVYAPTGQYDTAEPASPGKGMWTPMFTLGGTYYFDAAKTWSGSVLARYEIHSEQNDTDLRPGDDFHFEWGVGKSIGTWEVGATGYCQWQVTDGDGTPRDRVYAIGPEVSVFLPPVKMLLTLRSLWEFGAEERSEGVFTTLVLTKIF